MFMNSLRSAGLSGALLAMAVLVGCATTEEPAPAPAPAPATPAPAPEPMAKPMAKPTPKRMLPKVAPAPMVNKATLAADVLFDFDKSVVKPAGKATLDALAQRVGGMKLEVVIAIGHADSTGGDAYNQKLSVRRAEAVKAYMVSKGVERNRVYTEGKGEKEPVASNKTREGRAKNRRVELEAIGTK